MKGVKKELHISGCCCLPLRKNSPITHFSNHLDYVVGRDVCFALLPSLQVVGGFFFLVFCFFATVFIKFISLQELKQQHCPLAEELFLAEKSQALAVPAML